MKLERINDKEKVTEEKERGACGERGNKRNGMTQIGRSVLCMRRGVVMEASQERVELAARKEKPVPLTWGVGAGGTETSNPLLVLNGGGLLPLGGTEISGGYKGYGLSSMIEIFCGVLAGAHWGPHVRKWMSTSTEADLGQCFVAIDPEAFAPGFAERLQDFMETMRNLPTTDASNKVEVAGDMERRHEALVEQLGGIPYHKNQIAFVNELASKLGVKTVDLVA